MFAVEYGAAKREEGFATKTDALMWAGRERLESFEIRDASDTIVYQEFPEMRFA